MLNYIEYPAWITPEVIPGLPIRWYGVMYLFAFATTYLLMRRQIKKRNINVDNDDLLNLIFWCVIGLLVGARVFSALVYEAGDSYLTQPWLIFWPFRNGTFVGLQGMSYHGGLLGAIVAGLFWCKRNGYSPIFWADIIAIAAPLGYTFGRLGNFINGELYGRVSTAPFSMLFPTAARFPASESWVVETAESVGIPVTSPDMMVNLPRHASQLYEAALEGVILWLVLWFVVDRFARKPGIRLSSYIIGYGVARFIAEYFRQPDAHIGFVVSFVENPGPIYMLDSFFAFSMGQILSGLMVLAGIAVLLYFHFRGSGQERFAAYSTPDAGKTGESGKPSRSREADAAARAAAARKKRKKK